ncbi:hypothetical protein HAX54_012056 [Datura stramonium]|uniref:Uncharacterized protein n=1 Tax=Datura stramonium TaxID=4076 RepID=A0ABS8TL08_DATST|nr:hypothetical protein [Datura stramonium]
MANPTTQLNLLLEEVLTEVQRAEVVPQVEEAQLTEEARRVGAWNWLPLWHKETNKTSHVTEVETLYGMCSLRGSLIYKRLRHGPKGIDVMKTNEPEGQHAPVLSIIERNARIDNVLSHLYKMLMLQLRMSEVTKEQLNINYPLTEHFKALCRVGPGFREPFNHDDPTNYEKARVDSDLVSNANKREDSEMGEDAKAPMHDEK